MFISYIFEAVYGDLGSFWKLIRVCFLLGVLFCGFFFIAVIIENFEIDELKVKN